MAKKDILLKSIAKGLSKFAGPGGAPIESILTFYEEKQKQKRAAQLDATILEVENLRRETLDMSSETLEEIKELREQFILGMEICFSILEQNEKLLSSPDLEDNLPDLIEPYREQLQASGLITNKVLVDTLYDCYKTDVRLFLAHISVDFPVGELRSYEALPVIISDFLSRCSGQELKQKAKIFNALSKKNPGSKPLKVKSLMLQEQVINQIGG